MRLKNAVVHWNHEGVSLHREGSVHPLLAWIDLRRIAYVTEATGLAITDDHFLVFHVRDTLLHLSLSLEGALPLSDHVERKYGVTLGPKGTLANSVDNDSVVIWPTHEAGMTLGEAIDQAEPGTRVWSTYFLDDART